MHLTSAAREDVRDADGLRLAAYHEGGHVIAGVCWGGNVKSVTIVPDEWTDGRMQQDRMVSVDSLASSLTHARRRGDSVTAYCDQSQLLARVRVDLAGYAGEEVLKGVRPEDVAQLLEDGWGTEDDNDNHDLTSAQIALRAAYPRTRRLLTRLEAHYSLVVEYLANYRKQLDALAQALLEKRTLDWEGIYDVIGWLGGLRDWERRGMPAPPREVRIQRAALRVRAANLSSPRRRSERATA